MVCVAPSYVFYGPREGLLVLGHVDDFHVLDVGLEGLFRESLLLHAGVEQREVERGVFRLLLTHN